MKIHIKKDHIKENLKAEDVVSRRADIMFYGAIVFFYPVFLFLALLGGSIATGTLWRPFVFGTLFYIFAATVTIVLRNKAIKGSYNLYVPQKIEGTKREDYSLISTMVLQGRYEEADSEALQIFATEKTVDLPIVIGDALHKYKRYDMSMLWYQRGANIAAGPQRLYLLDRLREITENHIHDNSRVVMYLEKIFREFPNSTEGAEARTRLEYYTRTGRLK